MNKERNIYSRRDAPYVAPQRSNIEFSCVYTIALGLFTIILFLTIPIFSDEVVKKNGTVISNVKATVKRQTIRVEYENGRIEESSKKEFKTVRVRPIVWTSLLAALTIEQKKLEEEKEKERVAEASAEGSEWEFRPEEDQISPWKNAALGLIPGYSGLYRTKNYFGGGVFSALESLALFNFLDVAGAKKVTANIPEYYQTVNFIQLQVTAQLGYILKPKDPSSTTINNTSSYFTSENFSYGIIPDYILFGTRTYKYKGAISDRDLTSFDVQGKTNRAYSQELMNASAFLGAILLTDSVMSYFSASTWNEGNYTGTKSQKPTTRLSRFSRSLFFPGLGQIYGGDTIKGYSYLAVGLALFGNVAATESSVANTFRNYKDTLFVFMPTYSLYAFQFNPVQAYAVSNLLTKDKQEGLADAVEKRNQAWTYFGVFWAWNLLDATFLSGVNKLDNKIRITPNMSYRSAPGVGGSFRLEPYYTLNLTVEF